MIKAGTVFVYIVKIHVLYVLNSTHLHKEPNDEGHQEWQQSCLCYGHWQTYVEGATKGFTLECTA